MWPRFHFFVAFLGLFLKFARAGAAPLADSQLQALERLYNSTDGPRWYLNSLNGPGKAWNFSKIAGGRYLLDPCNDWYGVICRNATAIKLQLNVSKLHGTIPTELGLLTGLEHLDLNTNSLVGSLPTELGRLTGLKYLDLDTNSLEGSLPSELGRLTGLQQLGLYSNSLAGSLPSELGLLTGLEHLGLNTNSLVGSLPSELGLLIGLQQLDLYTNSLVGSLPTELGLLTGLQALGLFSNRLVGSIPTRLGLLTGLQFLVLYGNSLVGPLPTELGLLTGLQILSLYSNSLEGSLPTQMGLLTGLQNLYLYSNSLEGSLPTELGLLTGLIDLELNSNSLVGSIPTELGLLTGLQYLYLNSNSLVGPLPTDLGLLTGLKYLYLYSNSLEGSLPTELLLLTGLQQLYLYSNSLVESIPTELGLLTGLQYLYLNSNSLVGSIPTELGLLTGLQCIGLNSNSLVGSIPIELGLLTGMQKLGLYSNSLVGSIPTELGLLRGLQNLVLYSNRLEGSLPTELGLLTDLTYLYLSHNSLVGSLPTELWLLTGLQIIYLYHNSLEGSLPTELGLLTGLQFLYLYSNSFEGSIPTELGLVTGLQGLNLGTNSLVGSLPTELGLLTGLKYLFLNSNSLVGSLPTVLCLLLTGLQQLGLHTNSLVGSLPTELGQLTGLQYLFLESNSLVGSLPTQVGLLTGLQYIGLDSNSLVGSIPTELGLLTGLQYLGLNSNSLVGSLPEQFSNLDNLVVFDVYDNNLHGQLPSKLPPKLAVLSLAKNCFTGTLAPSLCITTSLQYLILDGLSAGEACQTPIWPINPFGLNALRSTSRVSGFIPACIYSLPKLKTLHVSGNGLRGSLQAGPAGWSANLTDLSLSHNTLTGDVPPSLKLRLGQLAKLDLSYNRLGGTLDGFHPASNQSGLFSMELNRLSGVIPSAITRINGAVSVLQGNMFDCSWLSRGASLPPADPVYSEYSCGSHSIDVYLFMFASFFALSAVSYCCLAFRWRPMLYWMAWRRKAALEALQRRPVSIQAVLYRVRSLAVLAGAVLLLVYLPLYGALKPFFKTYDFQYSWTVAAIMLSGTALAAVLLAFWALTLGVVSASILVWFRDLKGSTAALAEAAPAAAEARNVPTWSEQCRLALRLTIIVVLNLTAAGAANIAFVVVTVGDFSNDIKSLATVALGLYKTVWGIVLPIIVDGQALLLGVERAVEEQSKLKAGDLFRTLLLIVNNVVMPAFAIAVTDPSCFKNLLVSPPSVRSSYFAEFTIPANSHFSETEVPASASIEFTPAFSYNYECTSTLVEKFAPVFAQVALTSAFVPPLLATGARWALDSMEGCGLGDRIPSLSCILLGMLPSLLLYRKSERKAEDTKTFIKADELLRQSVSDLALMLSIGLVVPLLGLLFAVSIVFRCLMWEFLVDRFLSQPDEQLEDDLQTLEKQCLQLGSLGRTALYNARWLLAIFPSLFLALFVADIAGDAAGIKSGLWAPILMSLLPPAALYALTRLLPARPVLAEHLEPSDIKEAVFAPSQITIESAEDNPLYASVQKPSKAEDVEGDGTVEPDRGSKNDAIEVLKNGTQDDRNDFLELAVLSDPIPEATERSAEGVPAPPRRL